MRRRRRSRSLPRSMLSRLSVDSKSRSGNHLHHHIENETRPRLQSTRQSMMRKHQDHQFMMQTTRWTWTFTLWRSMRMIAISKLHQASQKQLRPHQNLDHYTHFHRNQTQSLILGYVIGRSHQVKKDQQGYHRDRTSMARISSAFVRFVPWFCLGCISRTYIVVC